MLDVGDNKLKLHEHLTIKYRGFDDWGCNINLKMNKQAPVIFHNLKGYDSLLIMQKNDKFDAKISAIINGLEKYTAFTINKKFGFRWQYVKQKNNRSLSWYLFKIRRLVFSWCFLKSLLKCVQNIMD